MADAFAALAAARTSVRGFTTQPVNDELLRELLATARLAPSGANLQPGSFVQVRGAVREGLSGALCAAFRDGAAEAEDYSYFPAPLPGHLRRRQVAAARALYDSIGTAREDRAGRDLQFERNFRFFEAPVALVVTIERGMGSGCFMDLGMALYGLLLAAQSQGLASCAIGALASYPSLVRSHLGLGPEHQIVCGVALGYPDLSAPVNRTRTSRLAVDDFFRVLG
ncbi:nitroreductase [Rhodoferax sp. OV413]|uniref:nitroreductase n=1 Tax=Rhodoferax sp. OV413 TaxID=1855285 RepID=UPI0025DE7F9F|nr:nitroreductase [Rhodoferax sp. OV413]